MGVRNAGVMGHFKGQFAAFRAVWVRDLRSDNYDKFMKNLRGEKLPEKEAARKTWSGEQAEKHGYTEVGEPEYTYDEDGGIERVEVVFSKPEE